MNGFLKFYVWSGGVGAKLSNFCEEVHGCLGYWFYNSASDPPPLLPSSVEAARRVFLWMNEIWWRDLVRGSPLSDVLEVVCWCWNQELYDFKSVPPLPPIGAVRVLNEWDSIRGGRAILCCWDCQVLFGEIIMFIFFDSFFLLFTMSTPHLTPSPF